MNTKDIEIAFAPILYPTAAEFQNFKQYVYSISKLSAVKQAGCVKVL